MHKYKSNKIRGGVSVLFKYMFLIFMSALALYPSIFVFISSFKTTQEIFLNSISLPKYWRMDNIVAVLTSPRLQMGYFNTFFYVAVTLICTAFLGSMAAYVSSRMAKSSALHLLFSFGIMIPMNAILVPTYLTTNALHLSGTRFGLILIYVAFAMPITVFILHGFMKNIPFEMEEAAVIDGCSKRRCFFSIILPMSKPGLATVLILNLMNVWNDYLFNMIIGSKKELYNITTTINQFKTDYRVDYGMICAGLLFSIIPLAIVYIVFQENVIRGMAAGAVKS